MNTPENILPESARADSQQQMGMPPWWTDADQTIVDDFEKWQRDGLPCEYSETGPSDPVAYAKWDAEGSRVARGVTCRQCQFWQSETGATGECNGPELKCGTTWARQLCEQWSGRHTS